MAHLLVAGGAGYVGSHALRALRRAGHTAVVLDDLRTGRPDFAQGAPLVRADVADRARVSEALRRYGPFDGLLHFAASIQVGESVARPLDYWANNVGGTAALLQEAVRHGVRAAVFSSTAAVYGTPREQPIPESAPVAPENPYGATKATVERMLADAEHAHGLRYAALRYFNACGADPEGGLGECHEPETHLVPLALEAAAGLREGFKLFGTDWPTPDGTCVRDFVHVADLADAHVLAVERLLDGHPSGAWNLGTGRGSSVREVLRAVEEVVGLPVPVTAAPRRPGDPAELVADSARFRRDFGWQPRRSDLPTVLRTAWDWLAEWKGV